MTNIKSIYLETWKDSLIPLCADRSGRIPTLCSEFKPSLSDQGLCFTQNRAPLDDIFKPTKYFKSFKKVFHSIETKTPIIKHKGSGRRYKKSFLINANRVMDLKNGIEWNDTQTAIFQLALHHNFDMPNIVDYLHLLFSEYRAPDHFLSLLLLSLDLQGLLLQVLRVHPQPQCRLLL